MPGNHNDAIITIALTRPERPLQGSLAYMLDLDRIIAPMPGYLVYETTLCLLTESFLVGYD